MDCRVRPVRSRRGWYARPVAHRTLAARGTFVEEIKGSRFHAVVFPMHTSADLAQEAAALRSVERDANHIAFAYRCGPEVRFSDDGEPGGTAGRPMLEVLIKRDLEFVGALVARVFGGVRLGAGGLARAYAGGVAKALDRVAVREVLDLQEFVVAVPFALGDAVLRLLPAWVEEHDPPAFDGQGMRLSGRVRADQSERLRDELREATRGQASLTLLGLASDQRK